jgi:hypothetical protein
MAKQSRCEMIQTKAVPDLTNFDIEQLEDLQRRVKTDIFALRHPQSKKYPKMKLVSFIDLIGSGDEWLRYEGGRANRAIYLVDHTLSDSNGMMLMIDVIEYGAGHSVTRICRINFNDRDWIYSMGDDADFFDDCVNEPLSLNRLCEDVGIDVRDESGVRDFFSTLFWGGLFEDDEELEKIVFRELELEMDLMAPPA